MKKRRTSKKNVCKNRVKCEGLTSKGRLKKGYKFLKGGKVIKVRTSKK